MKRARTFLILGSVCWMALGLGHPWFVDLPMHAGIGIGPLSSTHAVNGAMRASGLDFGVFGRTSHWWASTGFSLWLDVSCLGLGVMSLFMLLRWGLTPRQQAHLALFNAALALAFLALSVTCFIYPPVVASVIATASFGAAYVIAGREARAGAQ